METKKIQQQADDLRNNGQTQKAINLYRKLFKIYNEQKNSIMAGGQLQMIGVCYKIDNKIKESLKYLNQAAEYYRQHNQKDGLGNTLRDIGITWGYAKNYQQAKKFLLKSKEILKDSKDQAAYAMILAKIGLVEMRQKSFAKSEKSLNSAIKILSKTDHWFFQSTSLWHLAQLEAEKKNYSLAISNLEKSIKILDVHRQQQIHTRRYAQYWGLMANAYANLGQVDKAKKYYQKSMTVISKDNLTFSAKKVVVEDIKARETQKLLAK